MRNLFNIIKEWSKNNWMAILNFFLIILAYFTIQGHDEVIFTETVLGLLIIISMGYFVYDTFFKK